MSKRWPWVLEFDHRTRDYLLGYYELGEDDQYHWTGDIESGNLDDPPVERED